MLRQKRSHRLCRAGGACLFVWAVVAGCSSDSDSDLIEVKGTITYDGKPLTSGTITFFPADQESGNSATGTIDSSGQYRLSTYRGGEGALAGRYRIYIICWETPPRLGEKGVLIPGKSRIPLKYNHPKTSKLTASIQPGSSPVVDFHLEP